MRSYTFSVRVAMGTPLLNINRRMSAMYAPMYVSDTARRWAMQRIGNGSSLSGTSKAYESASCTLGVLPRMHR